MPFSATFKYKVHNRIKMLRQKRGLTLKQLGSDLGIRDNTLSQYENEKRNPSDEVWLKIAQYFGVSSAYLQGLTNDDGLVPDLIFDSLKRTTFSSDPDLDIDIRDTLENAFGMLLMENKKLQDEIREIKESKDEDNK